MNTFVSADLHLGHENIIKYCNRPFDNIEEMNERLIMNWNERVKPEDVIYNLGDFCFKGGLEGGQNKSLYWESQLNGKIIHVKGNHDKNNSTKTCLTAIFIDFAGYGIMGVHRPPMSCLEVPEFMDFVMCGHVHEKWKYQMLEETRNNKIPIPVINVGIDVWNFRPMKLVEIIEFYESLLK